MASTFFKTLKRFSICSVALALVVGVSSTAEAVVGSQWVGGGYGSNATAGRAWGSAANWSPAGVPSSSANLLFQEPSAAPYFTVNLGANRSAGSLLFSGTTTSSYTISGGAFSLTVGSGGITSNAVDSHGSYWTHDLGKVVLDGDQTWQGSGGVSVATLVTGTSIATMQTTVGITELTAGPTTTNFKVVSGGAVTISDGVGPQQFEVSGGSLTLTSPASITTANTDLLINGGTFTNRGATRTVDAVTLSSGTLNINDPTDPTSTGTLTAFSYLQSGGTVNMAIASASSYSSLVTTGTGGSPGDITFGGTLNIEWNAGNASLTSWSTAFNLFQANNGGTYSGNFSAVTMSNTTGTPFQGFSTFSPWGQEWRTSPNLNGQYLVFQSQNGVLAVVPEPSTYASAALGLAMAGVAQWLRSRRRSAAVAA